MTDKIKELEKHLERNNGFAKWEAIQALSIISRLKAENEELKFRTQNLTSDLTSAKAEVERLKNSDAVSREYVGICDKEIEDWKSLCNDYKSELLDVAKRIKHIESEARREFANLIERRLNSNTPRGAYLINIVDEVLTELTERKEDEE